MLTDKLAALRRDNRNLERENMALIHELDSVISERGDFESELSTVKAERDDFESECRLHREFRALMLSLVFPLVAVAEEGARRRLKLRQEAEYRSWLQMMKETVDG